jgi:hypothetical protein
MQTPPYIDIAAHTPKHLAPLFSLSIMLALREMAEQKISQHFMLCSSLPEMPQTDTHYLLLSAQAPQHAENIQYSHITAPIAMLALVQKIQRHLRNTAHIIPLQNHWQFDMTRRELRHISAETNLLLLTEMESKLLHYLLQHQGQLVARDQLMRGVWQYDDNAQSHTLETHLYRLRQKLGALTPKACEISGENGCYGLYLG